MKKQKSQNNIIDFELLYDHILVKPIRAESINGLVRPEQIEDKSEFGTVVKCGVGRLLNNGEIVPLRMQPGDTVYFGKYSALNLHNSGEDYVIVRDDDVMAVKHEKHTEKVSRGTSKKSTP